MNKPRNASDCTQPLHELAQQGIELFNTGMYYEAHEALEDAWHAERAPIRDLYRGILQIAVAYFHLLRGNYTGAIRMHSRSQKWLSGWEYECRGIDVGQMRKDFDQAIEALRLLGPENIEAFDSSLLKPILWR